MKQQYKFFEMGTFKNVAHVANKCETQNHTTDQ